MSISVANSEAPVISHCHVPINKSAHRGGHFQIRKATRRSEDSFESVNIVPLPIISISSIARQCDPIRVHLSISEGRYYVAAP